MRPGAGLDEASVAGAAEYGDAERYELSDKGRVEPGGNADGHVLLPRRGADALYGRLHLRVVDLPELAKGGREIHRTDDERVDDCIGIISQCCKQRTEIVPGTATLGLGIESALPMEVTVGGATVMVTNVERFEKL